MAPPSLPTAWTLIGTATGAVIGAAVTAAWRAKPRRQSDCNLLLPRFFLILALRENLGKLIDAVEPEDWEDFCEKLVEILKCISEKLARLEGNVQLHDEFKKVTKEIDAELVTCLQKVLGGASILEGYLPKAGQTWDALLGEKIEEERRFFDAENNDKELQEDLTRSCLHAIDLLLGELQPGLQQEDFSVDAKIHRSHLIKPVIKTYFSVDAKIHRSHRIQELVLIKPVIKTYDVVKVFYATDRQVTEDGDYTGEISRRTISEHDESNSDHLIADTAELPGVSPLQFGVAEIGIPHTHTVGAMEAPHSREESSPLKHVVIFSVDTKMRGNRAEFLSSVNRDLLQGESRGELLIFIHGYNVSHKGALKRAAQLKYDLRFQGAVIAYSWSSQGTLYGYSHDETTVEKTARYLQSFLLSIMHQVDAPRVHILAHSMGNRALIKALDMLHEGQKFPRPRCRLSQIIFAAADERHSTFEKLVKKMSEGSMFSSESDAPNSNESATTTSNAMSSLEDSPPHITVYCSTDDWALAASRYVHNFKRRLGDTRSFLEADANVASHDVVDASGMDISTLSHSYYGNVREVIEDLQVLLTKRIPASSRQKLHEIKHSRITFYAFNELKWRGHQRNG